MQINSSTNSTALGQVINPNQGVSREQVRVERAREQNVETNARPAQRLDVNEQALAIVDEQRQQQAQQQNLQQAVVLSKDDEYGNTAREQVSNSNLTAVSAYQGVENLQQRSDIEQLFGVDLYA
ncbi:hypothetical protein LP316_09780 [Thalassotalea sp. LPB0316]|uniref:hypothetical protein n=1 Tax=Thalassotalea sp. LPB0316 TaxID=2769490 RepID=UPI001867F8D2|nr:hypothetical protein [Thalassotalea sp. LPB0316]QOL24634.1 hypothetical protein LP316_09780 [Thalassotalea sp. LPB0316]